MLPCTPVSVPAKISWVGCLYFKDEWSNRDKDMLQATTIVIKTSIFLTIFTVGTKLLPKFSINMDLKPFVKFHDECALKHKPLSVPISYRFQTGPVPCKRCHKQIVIHAMVNACKRISEVNN